MNDRYSILGNSSTGVSAPGGRADITEMDRMQEASVVTIAEARRSVVASQTPSIYVPRRFRIGGLPGIRHGAAIVGTPQGDGTIAIEAHLTQYVDPTPEIWGTWVAEAADRHGDPEDTLETMIVSEHDLVEVGRFQGGCVLVDEVGRAKLSMWIEAGRAAYAADGLPELT